MDDDDVDPELVALFRQRFGIGSSAEDLTDTKVLSSASFVCDNSIDVALDMQGTRAAAAHIWAAMQARKYSTADWKKHELHPTEMDESTVNFIFMMDLLNFSFWSETEKQDARFCIEYRGRRWTGYWSLVAALRRALDEGKSLVNLRTKRARLLCCHLHPFPIYCVDQVHVKQRGIVVNIEIG